MTVRPIRVIALRSLFVACLAGVAWSGSLVETSVAQRRPKANQEVEPVEEPPANEAPVKAPKRGKGAAKTAPQKLPLETRDGLQLHAIYYPAPKPGKDVVPVVLLHMAKGSGADWAPLALSLQRAGHAVVVPDLRGHGDSTQLNRGTLDQATMRKGDFEAMITQDMERIKKFLIEENNNGNLNIRKLCVVGAELGAAVAINWAALDWSWPPLATGPQGQDVNGLVLITPIWSHKGMTIVNATKQDEMLRAISAMIIVGAKDNTNMKEARRLYQIFQRFHDEPPEAQKAEKKDLFFIPPDTSLRGTNMLGQKSLRPPLEPTGQNPGAILQFIELRLANKNFAWSERRLPLE